MLVAPGRGGATTRTCPATRTCSAPSPSSSRTTCSRTCGRWRATSTGGATRSARADVSPLGAGALAGSSLPLDPDARRRPSSGSRPGSRTRSTRSPTATSSPRRCSPPRSPRCTSRASARRSCSGRARSSGSSSSPTRTAPARRCCRRRRTPTSPSSPAGRPGRLIGHLTGFLATLKGLPARVQPRPAGGQGAAVRRGRHAAGSRWRALSGLLGDRASFDVDADARRGRRPRRRPRRTSPSTSCARGCPFREAHAVVGRARAPVARARHPARGAGDAEPRLGPDALGAARAGAGGAPAHHARRRRSRSRSPRQLEEARARLAEQRDWLAAEPGTR